MTEMMETLTFAQQRALYGLGYRGDIRFGVHGFSAHGGLARTVNVLKRKGLIEYAPGGLRDGDQQYRLTALGQGVADEIKEKGWWG